jgi:hypothetical protein
MNGAELKSKSLDMLRCVLQDSGMFHFYTLFGKKQGLRLLIDILLTL